MRKKLKFLFYLFVVGLMFSTIPHVLAEGTDSSSETEEVAVEATTAPEQSDDVVDESYHVVLPQWKETVPVSEGFEQVVSPSEFTNVNQADVVPIEESMNYGMEVVKLHDGNSIQIEVIVPETGLYEIGFDYYGTGEELTNPELAIKVNGEYQYMESRRIIAPVYWQDATEEFVTDSYGNELIPEQERVHEWNHVKAQDPSNLQADPLLFYLEEGTNLITFENTNSEMLLGQVTVSSPEKIMTYEEYAKQYEDEKIVQNALISVEAENLYEKSSSNVRPEPVKNPDVNPYSEKNALLNVLYAGAAPGESVSWEITVEESGLYQIGFKILQQDKYDSPVFRTIYIDGEVPFAEVEHYMINPATKWENHVVSNQEGDPYLFYLEEGTHTITLKVDASPLEPVIHDLKDIVSEINDLSLEIKKLTGGSTDSNREWDIKQYIPDIEEQLQGWIDRLEKDKEYIHELYNSPDDEESYEEVQLQQAIDKLKDLKANPNEIPNRLSVLSEGSSSVAQILGNLQTFMQSQPLKIDTVYVYGDEELPDPSVGILSKGWSKTKEFIYSFGKGDEDEYSEEETVEIWVARSQQQVQMMQNMADTMFTPESGIKVEFSVMPNEQKIILANAGGQTPDAVFGLSQGMPYELALRGAACDLTQFEDFEEVASQFAPGSFIPYTVDGGVYAIPETQDFQVLFYREDILNELNIPVPDTWEDVKEILPELQRYGMNFYIPISSSQANKTLNSTAPFIYQYGGDLYSEDGMTTAIDSEEAMEGLTLMTELYTVYGLPMQVPSFYDSFRSGTIPIGVSNFTDYVKITTAAPEIAGSWNIAPMPGVEQEDGTVVRWAPGGGQACLIFEDSDQKEEAWEVLKWWMSTETQVEFAINLQTMFGSDYMWNSANLEAFAQSPLPEEHKEVILEQWEWLYEVPRVPGSYMIEREISNVWNKVVFEGENLRVAVDDAVITINQEMQKKMEEFGYMKDGEVVEPYEVPTIESVEELLNSNEDSSDLDDDYKDSEEGSVNGED